MTPPTALKAVTVFVTGLNTWAATWLPGVWAGLSGVAAATALVFLVPNQPPPADEPMSLRVGHIDSGN